MCTCLGGEILSRAHSQREKFHREDAYTKGEDQVSQYHTDTAGIYRTGQCTNTGTPLFRIGKITGLTGCVPAVPAKTGRTGAIQLFQPINENNEIPDEKNEKQGYPFENLDEIMRKMKSKATHSKTQMRKMKNKVKSCEAQLCCVERVKTKDFGNETNEDENVYCRLFYEG